MQNERLSSFKSFVVVTTIISIAIQVLALTNLIKIVENQIKHNRIVEGQEALYTLPLPPNFGG